MTRDPSAARAVDGVEVAILGGGPVGCVLALALHALGRRCVLLERRTLGSAPHAALAARPLALSHATRLILERLGAWPDSRATTIETIHVSQAGVFGRTRLAAREAGVPALGYVIAYSDLLAALHAKLAASGMDLRRGVRGRAGRARDGAIEIQVADGAEATRAPGLAASTDSARDAFSVRCAVHAEGSDEEAPAKTYRQEAISAMLDVAPMAARTAFERFTPEGPLALLPMAGRYALVWSARPERARQLQEAPEPAFLNELRSVIGSRAGRLLGVGERLRFPLAQRRRAMPIGERAVYIGNSAQTLHPVAGQGLNLGVRDAWELAALLGEAHDPGEADLLRRYAARRRFDAHATSLTTDLLATRFAGSNAPLRGVAGLALAALDMMPGARRFFARRMIYGMRALP